MQLSGKPDKFATLTLFQLKSRLLLTKCHQLVARDQILVARNKRGHFLQDDITYLRVNSTFVYG